MTLSTDEIGSLALIASDPGSRSVRLYCGSNTSLRHAFWRHRRTRIDDYFSGSTSAEEEQAAFGVLQKTDSGPEARHYLRHITWDRMDDDFEEQVLTEWAQLAGTRMAQEVNQVARFVRNSIGAMNDATIEEQTAQYRQVWSGLSAGRRREIARRLGDDRVAMIGSALRQELMGRASRVETFRRAILETIADDADIVTHDLQLTRWQAFYVPSFADQLNAGEVRRLTTMLSDLVDPDLPVERREALFELYRMLQPETDAIERVIGQLGNATMAARYQRYLEARDAFLQNFSLTAPTPGLVDEILRALGEVGDRFDTLVDVVGGIGDAVGGITLDGLMNGVADDEARNAINELAGNDLPHLPMTMRIELCQRCLAGSTDDDDEQAIRRVLANTPGERLAERFLMVAALTWEALDSSFDGDEYDQLERLLTEV